MDYTSVYLPSTRHNKLHILDWQAPEKPKALLVYTHGYAGHAERYAHLAKAAFAHDIQSVGVDLTGHGKSGGERAYIDSFDEYIQDFKSLVEYATKKYPDLPVFLFGHSMGSLIACKYAIDHRPVIQGVIATGLALHVTDSVSPILVKLSKLISYVAPKFGIEKLKADLTAKNTSSVQRYIDDPLIYHGGIRARTGYEFMMAAENLRNRASEFDFPITLMHGGDDSLSNCKGSQEFYDRCSSEDKAIKILEGLGHEILNEENAPQTIADILAWIEDRVA